MTAGLSPAILAVALLGLAAAAYLAAWARPAALATATLIAEAFNPNLELPVVGVGPDRLLLVGTIIAVVVQRRAGMLPLRVRFGPVHLALGLAAVYVAANAVVAGTVTGEGFFALLDRFGLVPFAAFAAAPLLFPTPRDRNILLGGLVGFGAYLAVVAWAETLGVDPLVQPAWINDPSVGIHFGRARGPFVEAVANGMGLFACAVASAVAARTWRSPSARRFAQVVAVACVISTVFTVTRSIWLGTALASIVALAMDRRTRRVLVPGAVAVGATVAVLFVSVPEFAELAEQRSSEQRPLWDRLNSNAAAMVAVEHRPLFGLGWQQFRELGDEHYWVADDYPLTRVDLEVHNVPLSHAAELGIVGLALWGTAILAAVGGSLLRRPPADLALWRQGLVALAIQWAVVAALGPLSYPFPNLLLWLWAGIVAVPALGEPRAPAPAATTTAVGPTADRRPVLA